MTVKCLIEGLSILAKYMPKGTDSELRDAWQDTKGTDSGLRGAWPDTLGVGCVETSLISLEDQETLYYQLGFHCIEEKYWIVFV